MTHHRVTVKVAGLQPVQLLAALAGIAFIVFGVVGFTRTGVNDWATHSFVLGFSVNALHNLVHVIVGVLGLVMALGSGLARLYGWLLFLGFGALFVWGLMITGIVAQNPVSAIGNPLALNTNDNWLHLGIALFGLLLAVLPARRKLIEEDPDLPEPRDAYDERHDHVGPHDRVTHDGMTHDHIGRGDDRTIEHVDPAVSPRAQEPITKEQAVVDPKTDRVDRDKIDHRIKH
ncbi:DUF4383 domain-containing protein [Nocardia sp. NRRL S-836]|uniref:DUF4383 domain-containing protein n=1 Tax=Nocardia sp. NRRL S-836 TaxID=1519492 RepID=UPI0007C636D4|nr:DUF4383 domain-containing protein [Nocardia sp. NRRL S-836]